MKTELNKWLFIPGIIFMLAFSHCKVNYSFTGASIPPEVKTIFIGNFVNNASLVVPTLSQKLTDDFKDKFSSETSLVLVNSDGDLNLEGFIRDYRTQPVAIQTDDQAALNRLTVVIEVIYENTVDDKMSFKSTFSRYADYSSSQNLAAVQDALIEEITVMLVEDVFNKAIVNW